ncbi:hypothetical protein PULV_a1485 [Pseudoalteromonas ulvae UL12]|nr:hypothetical protein [Pseudoalteromonas ulvae UL12]
MRVYTVLVSFSYSQENERLGRFHPKAISALKAENFLYQYVIQYDKNS